MMILTLRNRSAVQRARCMVSAVAFALLATGATLHAQALNTQANAAIPTPHLDLHAAVTPLNFLAVPDTATSSSSISSSSDAAAEERFFLSGADANQPPPRRSYGRPRYSDKSHNPDGSNKYTFEFGAGLTVPTGTTNNTFTPSYKFQVGAGRNFNKNVAVLAQFDWDTFGIQTAALNKLLATYQTLCGTNCTGTQIQRIGGNMHVWSFSIDPMITFAQSDKTGAYLVGGVGFYHKFSNLTTPVQSTYYDPYYGYISYPANASIDTYTSNAPGFNGGAGFTYRPSRFAGERFFAEVRYVYVVNTARPYYDGTTGTKLSATYFNVFPQNSLRTSYLPITFGIRF